MSGAVKTRAVRPARMSATPPEAAAPLAARWWARVLAFLALALALAGTGISSYLVAVKLQGSEPVCRIAHGCATVQKSEYSEILGVPVSIPGLGGYLLLAALALVWITGWRGLRAHAALLAFYATLFGLAFSAYLTYVEWRVLEAWCIWCIMSALVMTALFATWLVLFVREARARRSSP